ncbi:MAG: hypothetical protein ACK5P5_05875 [Pseudobdellovibrionaceae bacterium]
MFSLATRRKIAAVLAVPMILSVQGCTDEEVLAVVGGAAIVGGVVAIGAAVSDSNDDYGSGYYAQNPPNYYGPQHPPVYGGGYGYEPRPWGFRNISNKQTSEVSTEELNTISLMASHYNLPMASAATLKRTMRATLKTQNLQPLFDLGLSRSDLSDIGRLQMISDSGVENLAAKLNVSTHRARGVVQQLILDVKQSQDQK